MKKNLLLIFACLSYVTYAQTNTATQVKNHTYEINILRKGSPGHVIKNQTMGIADTVVAFVFGSVIEKQTSASFVNVTFTNKNGQTFSTSTDMEGKFKMHLKLGEYKVKFVAQSNNQVIIEKLLLSSGQLQEMMIDMGTPSGHFTYEINSTKPLSAKELKQKEAQLQIEK